MFLGQYQHSIDNKGRLTIPARFRDLLAVDGAYLSQGFDSSIMVMPPDHFLTIYERVNSTNVTDPAARDFRRWFFKGAEKVEVDKAGRILLPQHLREKVGIQGEAILVGLGPYFELWSPENWKLQEEKLDNIEANSFAGLDLSYG